MRAISLFDFKFSDYKSIPKLKVGGAGGLSGMDMEKELIALAKRKLRKWLSEAFSWKRQYSSPSEILTGSIWKPKSLQN